MIKFIKSRLNKKGFTLVELLIVIAVLGIIAGIGVNSMGGITDTFRKKADQESMKMLARVVEVNILAGQIDVSTDEKAKTGAIRVIADEKKEPASGGEFVVTSVDVTEGKITFSYGDADPLATETLDIETTAIIK